MIYVTSDLHFNHSNIIKYCNRPFINTFEMNQKLINNWNSVVQRGDSVFVLGDFMFGRKAEHDADYFLSNLNGNKILITGNHDKKEVINARGWKEVHKTIYETEINGQYIVMCHYPMRSWNHFFRNSWHLFGHVHNKMEPYGLSFDVGVDSWNYMPISFDQVKEKMNSLSAKNEQDYNK